MSDWKLHDAKNRFSALIDAALLKGPQRVTRRGRPAVVVVAADEFDKMQRAAVRPARDFVAFLTEGAQTDLLSEELEGAKQALRMRDPFDA